MVLQRSKAARSRGFPFYGHVTAAGMSNEESPMPDAGSREPSTGSATLLWDRQNCVPLTRCLSEDDLVLLLTPAVVPPESQPSTASDPFEPLGQELAKRHYKVRHVPYTKNRGLTGVHTAFIRKADVIFFVVTGPSADNEPPQTDLADAVAEACEARPLLVVFCCHVETHEIHQYDFPTVIKATGFSVPDLRAVSSLLLDGEVASSRSTCQLSPRITTDVPATWSVQPCDYERDLIGIHALWNDNVPRQFHLDAVVLGSLLRRDGYAMHHVVRDTPNGDVLGFCATFTTFADSKEEQLIGSLAALVVKKEFRRRGIGRKLHDEALGRLGKIGGVHRVQLGTTFPRLLYGIPVGHPDTEWFRKRGWPLDLSGPGAGHIRADWLLRFCDTPPLNLASAGLNFRPCELSDSREVLEMVARESERKHAFGWYDQYARIIDSGFIGDVILGFEGSTMVATAITYTSPAGNPTASDIPWASSIGTDVGGVTCICIKGERRDRYSV